MIPRKDDPWWDQVGLAYPEDGVVPDAGGKWPGARPAGGNDGRVRVGHVMPVGYLGGAERVQLAIAKAVDPARVANAGVVVIEEVSLHPLIRREFAALCPVGTGYDAARVLAGSCDVLLVWGSVSAAWCVADLSPAPRVVSISHAPTHPECRYCNETYANVDGIDAVVAVHELALGPVPEPLRSEAAVIMNCVDTSRMTVTFERETERDMLGVPRDARMVLSVGRLSHEKNPLAIAEVALVDPALYVVIAGEGAERPALDAFKDAHGLTNLRLIGGNTDVGSLFNAADVSLSVADYESFGLSMAEALWMGCPLIATPTGIIASHPKLARHVSFKPSARELAAAVNADLADFRTSGRVALAAEVARAEFSPERFGREWTDYLVAAAAKRGGTRAERVCRWRECATGCPSTHCLKLRGDGEGGKLCSLAHCLTTCGSREP